MHTGTLLHLTHYDPIWNKSKNREGRFDPPTVCACIDAAAASGMDLLILDIEDAVVYRRSPGLKKRYSAPMRDLELLVKRARARGLEVVPKLNFARSAYHRHSAWIWCSGQGDW